ncbi:MAG: STAS domain-containing protein [Candidatus Riflebacteria bacterium]|nr:STAS domain-containing protein [Candidatus Riflebacteria bacterium]
MEFQVCDYGLYKVVMLLEGMGKAELGELDAIIKGQIQAGAQYLILDFSTVQTINSAAIGSIILGNSILKARGGRLIMVGCNELIKGVFKLIGYLEKFTIANTLPEGIEMAQNAILRT